MTGAALAVAFVTSTGWALFRASQQHGRMIRPVMTMGVTGVLLASYLGGGL